MSSTCIVAHMLLISHLIPRWSIPIKKQENEQAQVPISWAVALVVFVYIIKFNS